MQTGWAVGWGAAALLYTLLSANLPEALTWRVMFWIGLAPAALVFWIRRFVEEPAINPRAGVSVGLMHMFSALRPPFLATTWRVAMMVTGAQGSQLCAHDLPAAVSENRASSDFGWHRQLSDGADPGGVLRLPVRRLSV